MQLNICLLQWSTDRSKLAGMEANKENEIKKICSQDIKSPSNICEEKIEGAARFDFRLRRPSFIDLPATPGPSSQECNRAEWRNFSSSDSDNDGGIDRDVEGDSIGSTKKGKIAVPITTFGRSRTRLLDPPPFTPAVKNQITSALRCRKASLNTLKEDFETKEDSETQEEARHLNSNLSPTPAPSTHEDEHEVLDDDDSIPDYKKMVQNESKWSLWVQWTSLLLLITVLVCSVEIKEVEAVKWLGLNLWRWQALTLVIFSGRLISSWIVKIFVFLIERRCLLKKKVLYFVYGLRSSVKNCIWLALVLGVWEVIFNGYEHTSAVKVVTKVLWCVCTVSIAWMLKVLILKVAANSFHRAAYFDRIQDCVFNQYLLETLSAPPTMGPSFQSSESQPEHAKSKSRKDQVQGSPTMNYPASGWNAERAQDIEQGNNSPKGQRITSSNVDMPTEEQVHVPKKQRRILNWIHFFPLHWRHYPKDDKKSGISGGAATVPLFAKSSQPIEQDKLQQLTSETVSAWTLRRLMKNIRSTNMTTYSSIIAQEERREIDSENQAKSAAKQIFYNMARPGQKYLMFKDFLYFLPEDQATRAFSLFEVSEHGTISKKALTKWVVNVYKERRALALTLNDNKTVVAKLHHVFDAVLAVIVFIICLLISGVDTSRLLVFFSSIFIPCVFIFGNAAKITFESLVFLFVMHPFDVGDRVCVDGQTLLVEEMNVLNTIFLTGANEKIYYPNSILSSKPISNFHRSPDQWEGIDFQIHISTPIEKLSKLKEKMQRYIDSLPQFWYPDFRIICKDIENSNKMMMSMWIQHHLNFQEAGERFQRRSNMLLHMKQQLEDLGISYQLPGQQITVTGIPILDAPTR